MRERRTNGLLWYQFALLAEHADLITHGIFSRHGGVSTVPFAGLNAGNTVGDDPEAVGENRRRIIATLPGHPILVTAHPIHGADVVVIGDDSRYKNAVGTQYIATKADAMLTQVPGLGLFWAYADCTPIMLFDRAHQAIALVHAGWRGTAAGVAATAINALVEHFGTRPRDLLVGLGPTIGPCCYEVDAPVQAAYAANAFAQEHAVFSTIAVTDAAGTTRPSLRLDVMASNERQIRALGIPRDQIESFDLCTGHHLDQFYSFRKEQRQTGRHAVVIGLR